MPQDRPAEPGMSIDEVDTPALIVDLDALEANLDHMAALAAAAGVKLRPHAKTHKSPVIAHMQMARGAIGQ
jgi:3-hydroxy-D-aspartate aldolase